MEQALEPAIKRLIKGFSALSRAVVGGTDGSNSPTPRGEGFSALSRAVVGGTKLAEICNQYLQKFQCSQSSRGWWNIALSLVCAAPQAFQCSQSSRGWWNRPHWLNTERRDPFQCSQSSRGWWNLDRVLKAATSRAVSVLSVEPWLVERWCGWPPSAGWACFSALSRAVVGGT